MTIVHNPKLIDLDFSNHRKSSKKEEYQKQNSAYQILCTRKVSSFGKIDSKLQIV